jgi:hypothetical protein
MNGRGHAGDLERGVRDERAIACEHQLSISCNNSGERSVRRAVTLAPRQHRAENGGAATAQWGAQGSCVRG